MFSITCQRAGENWLTFFRESMGRVPGDDIFEIPGQRWATQQIIQNLRTSAGKRWDNYE